MPTFQIQPPAGAPLNTIGEYIMLNNNCKKIPKQDRRYKSEVEQEFSKSRELYYQRKIAKPASLFDINQTASPLGLQRTATATPNVSQFRPKEVTQTIRANGEYSFEGKLGGKILHSFEAPPPVERKLLTGFAGKMEKLAHAIGNNAKTGVERPGLRNISEFILKHLKR